MGKLTEALEATKELRKQFTKKTTKKAKPLTAKAQKVQTYIYDKRPFGCNTDAVANLMEFMSGEKIAKEKDTSKEQFKSVKGAIVKYVKGKDAAQTKHSKGILIEDTNPSDYLRWTDHDGQSLSYDRTKEKFKPATDAEIRRYFA